MIHGIHGQHAQDLQRRGIIHTDADAHHVIIPITATNRLILELLDRGVRQSEIINFAGSMMTSPNAVTNMHFLFGPNATKNLKVAVAGNIHHRALDILDAAKAQNIEIIETTRTEHDKHMAIIQGLAHLVLLLAGDQADTQSSDTLIRPWITPVGTITDMIFANSFAEERAIEFFELLMKNEGKIFESFRLMTEKHIPESIAEKFSTPNFERVLSFAGEMRITETELSNVRSSLNEEGRRFIERTVKQIREKNT